MFHAGAGNDRLVVSDLAFRLADGGTGTDTLALAGAGQTLDLPIRAVAAKLEGIERIDLTGSGDNTLDRQPARRAGRNRRRVAGGKHVLVVERQCRRHGAVRRSAAGRRPARSPMRDGTFDRWVLGNAEVHVEQGRMLRRVERSPLSSLNGSTGFKLSGVAASDCSGFSVASAGDVNGDGFDDLIVGARVPTPNGSTPARATWCSARPRASPPTSTSRP